MNSHSTFVLVSTEQFSPLYFLLKPSLSLKDMADGDAERTHFHEELLNSKGN